MCESIVSRHSYIFLVWRVSWLPVWEHTTSCRRLPESEAQGCASLWDPSRSCSPKEMARGMRQDSSVCRPLRCKSLEVPRGVLRGQNPRPDSKSGILLYNMAEQTGDAFYLKNRILQALMAAQETTANLLGNVFFLLSRNESVFRKLRAEVLSVGDRLTAKELTAMKYLKNDINEGKPPSCHKPCITPLTIMLPG